MSKYAARVPTKQASLACKLSEKERAFLDSYNSGSGPSKVDAAKAAGVPHTGDAALARFAEKTLKKKALLTEICRYQLEDYFLKYLTLEERLVFLGTEDPVRYGAIKLAIDSIHTASIAGAFAEVGVYQGNTSKIIHALAPERDFYLFDSFEGFPQRDLEGRDDVRFKDTGIETVQYALGDLEHVYIRKGYFPETAKGLEDERFAFVMLDLDLYPGTLSGLEFFYPRVVPGGYLFLHDYSDGCDVYKAVNEFMRDKPEGVVPIPDVWGSAIVIKNRV